MPEVGIELYRVIDISGADAVEFLQGQLTQDVTRLNAADRLLAAWCSARGRVIVVVRLVATENGIAMIVPADMLDKVHKTLLMYRFRSKVEMTISAKDGSGLLAPDECDPLALIKACIPHIDARNTEAFTPHMLNLDKLDAISFSKGCYTGQEIVARTEHRGKSKRRMMRYIASDEGIDVGADVSDGERNIGSVVNVVGRELLAVTPIDRHDQALRVGDVRIEPQKLPYSL